MKYRLIHLTGSLTGRVHDVERAELVLGRDPVLAHVVFSPSDRGVSRRHALVRAEQGFLLLRDLESTGGTLLNGKPVSQARLAPGDEVQLGIEGPRLRVELEEGAVMQTPFPEVMPEPPTPAPAPAHRLRLTFLSGARAGDSLELSGSVLRVGRAPGSSVWTPDDKVTSAQHARIVRLEGAYVLIDLESRNGTYLNGHRVQRARLASGDVVGLGSTGPELRVEVLGLEAGGDTVEIPNFGELVSRRRPAVKVRDVAVPDGGLVIGRALDCGLRLDSPIVSLAHARVRAEGDGFVIEDAGSTNGTWMNGRRLEGSHPFGPGSVAVVGPFELQAGATTLEVRDTRNRARLDVREASVRVGDRTLLDRVSVSFPPGSFNAIIGPSGSGKSTLLRVLGGLQRLDDGQVLVDGLDVADDDRLERLIGFVPQDDVVHTALPVGRTLDHAARLRLPADTPDEQRRRRVTEVLSLLELTEHRDTLVSSLSGGQRKRVSIAAELLTEPNFLLLDEPTSGLDPGLEESLMLLLKELTHKGRTVVLVTHTLGHVHLCDSVALVAEGHLAFFGSPADARRHFSVESLVNLYARLRERPAEEWRAGFEAGAAWRERVQAPLREMPDGAFVRAVPAPRPPGPVRQLGVLTRRYAEILTRDRRNLALLLAQAPIIAVLVGLSLLHGETAAAYTRPVNTLLFLSALTAVWFGCSNAARELVKERAIHLREARSGVGALPWVTSKVLVLSALATVQCAAYLAVLGPWFTPPGPWPLLLPPLVGAALVGILLGLAVSALSRSADRAMSLLPIILIPQVLFTAPAVHMDVQHVAGLVARAMPTWWAFDLLRRVSLLDSEGRSDEQIEAVLDGDGPAVLLGRDRVERMLEDGYPMYQYRDRLETAWPASAPERWGERMPAARPHARAALVDLAVLAAFGVLLFGLVLAASARHGTASR